MLSLAKGKEYLLGDKGIADGSRKQSLEYRLETLDVSCLFLFAKLHAFLFASHLLTFIHYRSPKQSARDLANGALEIYRHEFKDIRGGADSHEQTADAAKETKKIEKMINEAKKRST